jgi:hypothetical protein
MVTEAAQRGPFLTLEAAPNISGERNAMYVPRYSLAERDRRWALARELMAAEDVEALIACGEPECAGGVAFAPDAYGLACWKPGISWLSRSVTRFRTSRPPR